jgi:hypothetical protein
MFLAKLGDKYINTATYTREKMLDWGRGGIWKKVCKVREREEREKGQGGREEREKRERERETWDIYTCTLTTHTYLHTYTYLPTYMYLHTTSIRPEDIGTYIPTVHMYLHMYLQHTYIPIFLHTVIPTYVHHTYTIHKFLRTLYYIHIYTNRG